MHSRDIAKHQGPFGTAFSWQHHRAVLRRLPTPGAHILQETTGEHRCAAFHATPGFGGHGRAIAILNAWWDEDGDEVQAVTVAHSHVDCVRCGAYLSRDRQPAWRWRTLHWCRGDESVPTASPCYPFPAKKP